MKNFYKLLVACLVAGQLVAQETSKSDKVYSAKSLSFRKTEALRDMAPVTPVIKEKKKSINNKLRRYKHVNPNALPVGNDPVWQDKMGTQFGKAPIENFSGVSNGETGSVPPDPSGAAGPDHYVQMVNTAFKIFNKEGDVLYGPSTLGSIWDNGVNDGDPIVMYDRFAERWFLSQFEVSGNKLLVAVSETEDPLGSYYTYEFPLTSFPDYPKYSIWSDGYYVTANKSGEKCFVLEREKMIDGDPDAQIVGFGIPSLETNGFFSMLPAHADMSLPAEGTPGYLFYFQDDGWGGVSEDQIKIWEITVDWEDTDNSEITDPFELPVSPFDSEFTTAWDDIEQPNGQHLDAVPGAFMYMAQYTQWSGHNTIMLNHAVDVDGTNHAGIRWYELRKNNNGGDWYVYQEGTYAPDEHSRWMGSMAMDYQGNIGLAYSIASTELHASLRYTGRYAGDPLGEMTVEEQVIVDGTSSQTGTNRFGDYAQLTLDPTDNGTFWFTGEYLSSGWKTRITSFKLANDLDNDLGAVQLSGPIDALLSDSETISVVLKNFGLLGQSNFELGYIINDGAPVIETYTEELASLATANYDFTQTADFSTEGIYEVKIFTALSTDEDVMNDTLTVAVEHLLANNLGVTHINSPTSGLGLGEETIQVTIKNFGVDEQVDFPVSYEIDGGTVVTETVTEALPGQTTMTYSFDTDADLSDLGMYEIKAYTSLVSDGYVLNDSTTVVVEHEECLPTSDCTSGDVITNFSIGELDNDSECSPGGYGDFTFMSVNLLQGEAYEMEVSANGFNQRITIWIDYNDNNYFEESEQVITNFSFSGSGSTLVGISGIAPLGEHIMRVRMRWNGSSEDPCVTYQYGETEDYTVNITNDFDVNENESASLQLLYESGKRFTVSFPELKEAATLTVFNTMGQLVYQKELGSSGSGIYHHVDLATMPMGHYLVKLNSKSYNTVRRILIE